MTSYDAPSENPGGVSYPFRSGPKPADREPQVFPQTTNQAANTGTVPGSGAPDHGNDVRGVFGNVSPPPSFLP